MSYLTVFVKVSLNTTQLRACYFFLGRVLKIPESDY